MDARKIEYEDSEYFFAICASLRSNRAPPRLCTHQTCTTHTKPDTKPNDLLFTEISFIGSSRGTCCAIIFASDGLSVSQSHTRAPRALRARLSPFPHARGASIATDGLSSIACPGAGTLAVHSARLPRAPRSLRAPSVTHLSRFTFTPFCGSKTHRTTTTI